MAIGDGGGSDSSHPLFDMDLTVFLRYASTMIPIDMPLDLIVTWLLFSALSTRRKKSYRKA